MLVDSTFTPSRLDFMPFHALIAGPLIHSSANCGIALILVATIVYSCVGSAQASQVRTKTNYADPRLGDVPGKSSSDVRS